MNVKTNAEINVNLHAAATNAGPLWIGEDGKTLANTVKWIHHAGKCAMDQVQNVTTVGLILIGITGRIHANPVGIPTMKNAGMHAWNKDLAKQNVLIQDAMTVMKHRMIAGMTVNGTDLAMKYAIGKVVIVAGLKLDVMIGAQTNYLLYVTNACKMHLMDANGNAMEEHVTNVGKNSTAITMITVMRETCVQVVSVMKSCLGIVKIHLWPFSPLMMLVKKMLSLMLINL